MSEADPIAERFARETAAHEMTILHDDGLYRHLKFKNPGNSGYWYELITAPNSLTFRGDGESYVFHRLADMFEFFRSNPDRKTHRISPDYWAEKLTSNRDCVEVYSRERLDEQVAAVLKGAEEEYPGVTDAWTFATEEGLDWDVEDEDCAREALRDFQHGKFQFTDTCEWDLRDFDWWFLWALHGIVAGIARYDAARATAGVRVASTSPTEPAELGAWLRALPQRTILSDRNGNPCQRSTGVEHVHRSPNRDFPALFVFGDPFELTEGDEAIGQLAKFYASFTVLALGDGGDGK